jgi:hypothetical protein
MAKLTSQQMQDTLEALIDSHNLASVLQALAYVCGEKAEHLRVNWQDTTAARHWEKAGCELDTLARKQENRTGERQEY